MREKLSDVYIGNSFSLNPLEQKAEFRKIKEKILNPGEEMDPEEVHRLLKTTGERLKATEDLIYECAILLAQAQCFDFMREIDKKEGRVLEELMTDKQR